MTGGGGMQIVSEVLLAGVLFFIAKEDFYRHRIPNILLPVLLVIGLSQTVGKGLYLTIGYRSLLSMWYGSAFLYWWNMLKGMAIGMLIPLVLLLPLYFVKICGAGDVKLLAVMGLIRGWPGSVSWFVCVLVWMGLVSAGYLLRGGVLAERMQVLKKYVETLFLTGTLVPYRNSDEHMPVMPMAIPVFLGNVMWLIRYMVKGGLL